MSCLFLSGPPSRPPVPVSKPRCSIVCRFTQPCFSLAHKIDDTKEMALCFCIIAQYMVKTKFDDALKILVACEKMAELLVANMQFVNLFVSYLKLFIFH